MKRPFTLARPGNRRNLTTQPLIVVLRQVPAIRILAPSLIERLFSHSQATNATMPQPIEANPTPKAIFSLDKPRPMQGSH